MKHLPIILFVLYQSSLIYLDSINVIEFNLSYSLISIFLIAYSGYNAYLKSQEIPQLTDEINKLLEERDNEIRLIKNDLASHSMAKPDSNITNFRF